MQVILSNFPSIKLSYENFTHKKVYNTDLYLAIPEGIKCFAWFTTYKDNNVCFIMEITNNTQITNVTIKPCCFCQEVAYGTILYGTMFNNLNNTFFTIEDIFYYKGQNIATHNWGRKNNFLLQLMNNDIEQLSYNRQFIVFGLPLLSRSLDLLFTNIKSLNYNISVIQYRKYSSCNNYYFTPYADIIKNVVLDYSSCNPYHKINTSHATQSTQSTKGNVYHPLKQNSILLQANNTQYKNTQYKNTQYKNTQYNKSHANKSQDSNHLHISKRQVVFKITADIQNDIYNLYALDKQGGDSFYGFAHIPNFKTSVMMNKFYRNIKENINLDMLEESDSEDEFENDDPLRFVNLTKTHNFICAYNNKFRKWYPIQLAQDNISIIRQSELLLLDKNKY